MTGSVTKLCDIDSLTIPDDMLSVHADEAQIEADLSRLGRRYATKQPATSVRAGDWVRCQADEARYPDKRPVFLYPSLSVPGAKEAESAMLGKTVGETVSVPLKGTLTSLTIREITRLTPVEVTDALVASLGLDGVSTREEYRTYLREKALTDQRMERHKEITRYLMDQMENNSEFSYDEAAMERYVEQCREEYAAQCTAGEEEDVPEEPPEDFRVAVISQEKCNWMALAFCQSHGIEIDETAVSEEADQMQEMMALTGEPIPDRETLREMARSGEAQNALFFYIDSLITQRMEGSHGNG